MIMIPDEESREGRPGRSPLRVRCAIPAQNFLELTEILALNQEAFSFSRSLNYRLNYSITENVVCELSFIHWVKCNLRK